MSATNECAGVEAAGRTHDATQFQPIMATAIDRTPRRAKRRCCADHPQNDDARRTSPSTSSEATTAPEKRSRVDDPPSPHTATSTIKCFDASSALEILDVVGCGRSAITVTAELRGYGIVAAKALPRRLNANSTHDDASSSSSSSLMLSLPYEVVVLSLLGGHPRVPKLVGVCIEADEILVLQEFVRGSDLWRLLHGTGDGRRRVALSDAARIVHDVADALDHLHAVCGVVHCDLTPKNVLVDARSRRGFLIDFGCAIAPSHARTGGADVGTGTDDRCAGAGWQGRASTAYLAPEVLSENRHTPESDMWSLGVIVAELLTHAAPWTGLSDGEIEYAVCSERRCPLPPLPPSPWNNNQARTR